jgi:hypothetical protein
MHAVATGSIRTRLTEKTHKSLSQTSTHILSGNYDIPPFPTSTSEASNQRDMLHQYMHTWVISKKKKGKPMHASSISVSYSEKTTTSTATEI